MDTYTYDSNGNQVTRTVEGVSWTLTYNAEIRLASLGDGNGNNESYLYDGDGVRVARMRNGDATYLFMGGMYELTLALPEESVSGSKSYYAIEGQLLAMSDGSTTSYLLTDHLGSVVGVVGETGSLLEERRYLPFGEERVLSGTAQTELSFTGQRALTGTGLLDYHARQYDPSLRTFIQPDPIIPNPYGVLDYNRYLYVHANPVRFTDPSGNRVCENGDCQIDPYITKIQDEFGWVMDDTNMTTKLIQDILITGRRIRTYVDNLTGGNGRNWMDRYLGYLSLSVSRGDRGSNWPADHITLPDYLKDQFADFNHWYIAHELGHVWDNSASPSGIGVYIGGGLSDALNQFTGGEVSGSLHLRFYNPMPTRNDPYVKEPFTSHPFDNEGPYYGNGSTADYFAEAFALNIFSKSDVPLMASMWVDAMIGCEVAYLFLR